MISTGFYEWYLGGGEVLTQESEDVSILRHQSVGDIWVLGSVQLVDQLSRVRIVAPSIVWARFFTIVFSRFQVLRSGDSLGGQEGSQNDESREGEFGEHVCGVFGMGLDRRVSVWSWGR